MLISIDRLQLQVRLILVWAVASLIGLFLLNIWVALGFTSALAYVMQVIWRTVLKNNVSFTVVTSKRR